MDLDSRRKAIKPNHRPWVGLTRIFNKFIICSMKKDVCSAIREKYDEIHQYKHQVVVPAGGLSSPEAGVPGGYLFPDRAKHNEDQSDSRQLGEHSRSDTQSAGYLGEAQEDCEARAHPDALGSFRRLCRMTIAAGNED